MQLARFAAVSWAAANFHSWRIQRLCGIYWWIFENYFLADPDIASSLWAMRL
jgi:hypothetical protein